MRFTALFSLLVFLIGFSGDAYTQDVKTSVGIVDMHYLMQETKAAKSIQEQLTKLRNDYKKTLGVKEKELRLGEQALVEKKNQLSAEDFKSERDAFEKKLLAVQKEVQDKRQKLDGAFSKAMNMLRSKAVNLIAEKAKERGVTLVLPRKNVIIVDQTLDMTPEIVEQLNKTLDYIDLEVE